MTTLRTGPLAVAIPAALPPSAPPLAPVPADAEAGALPAERPDAPFPARAEAVEGRTYGATARTRTATRLGTLIDVRA
jgi:hypothetical protein